MRGEADHGLRICQHPPPTGRGRLGAQTHIAQAGFRQNAKAELDRALHDQQIVQIRQNMLDRDATSHQKLKKL